MGAGSCDRCCHSARRRAPGNSRTADSLGSADASGEDTGCRLDTAVSSPDTASSREDASVGA